MSYKLSARTACAALMLSVVGVAALVVPLPANAATPSSASSASDVLREGVGLGDRPSIRVRRFQRILDRRGFDLGPPGVDGRFGPLTAAAVRRLQSRYGLVVDGVVGAKTRRLLGLIERFERAGRTQTDRGRRTAPQPQTPAQTPQPRRPAQRPRTQPSQPQPPAQTTERAPRQPTTQAQPQTSAPTGTSESGPTEGIDWVTVGAILVGALAAAALAGALVRRRTPPTAPTIVPFNRDLFVEGHSDELGSFGGMALGTAVPPRAADDPSETQYLVDDPRKPAPVWVRGSDIRRSPSRLPQGELVIGYVTTNGDPTREQEAFMEIEDLCEQAGWTLDEIIRDREKGRMADRPGLRRALESIAAGKARGLVVTDAQSVTDSLADLGALLEWFRDADAALVALDLDIDTTTPHGHRTASALMAVAGWETERRSARARSGLAQVEPRERSSRLSYEERENLAERIAAMRHAGMTLQAIADQLNSEKVPTPRGSTWRPSTVSAVAGNTRTPRSIRSELPPLQGKRGR
jgi:DNA invertase Pin-like site-specific DNA recombinase/peptidoglycan hydrolase-like protein with peptidoglycan-binding domain